MEPDIIHHLHDCADGPLLRGGCPAVEIVDARILGRTHCIVAHCCWWERGLRQRRGVIDMIAAATGFDVEILRGTNERYWPAWVGRCGSGILDRLPIVHRSRFGHAYYLRRDRLRACLPAPRCLTCGRRFRWLDQDIREVSLQEIWIDRGARRGHPYRRTHLGIGLVHGGACFLAHVEGIRRKEREIWQTERDRREHLRTMDRSLGRLRRVLNDRTMSETGRRAALSSLREEFERLRTSPGS